MEVETAVFITGWFVVKSCVKWLGNVQMLHLHLVFLARFDFHLLDSDAGLLVLRPVELPSYVNRLSCKQCVLLKYMKNRVTAKMVL